MAKRKKQTTSLQARVELACDAVVDAANAWNEAVNDLEQAKERVQECEDFHRHCVAQYADLVGGRVK